MTHSSLTIEHALLGFLRQQPRHGYEIYQQLSDPAGLWQAWRLKQSQLYALLAKLEEAGLIVATLQFQEARPPRKVLHLSESGCTAFLDWVQSPVVHARQMRLEFLAKFYFAQREGVEVARQLVEQQQAVCRTWLAQQQRQAQPVPDPDTYPWFVNQFRLTQIQALLIWLELCAQTLVLSESAI
ncbi:MAG: PadR family transcriptional regulator [Chloroflexota bacterium]|nr:PadR family transcriptional regulator [Chloroflexota bacterium]